MRILIFHSYLLRGTGSNIYNANLVRALAAMGHEVHLFCLDRSRDRIVSYVGKLIVSKGVDLLLAAWPLVVERVADARLVVVGFGTYFDALGGFVGALAAGDLDDLAEVAA